MASVSEPRTVSFNDPQIQRQVNSLRQTDNISSWFYLAREYAWLVLIIGPTLFFYDWLSTAGHSWLWAIPVTVLAIILVGAVQQRLATLTHEAAHYMLFHNRLLNEIASELFCMFPIYGTTHSYRVQHLGHHQYPNDPDAYPDWLQMTRSGHRFQFPMTVRQFLWHCVLKQIAMPLYPLRYALVRASYVVDKGEGTPYRMVRRQRRDSSPGDGVLSGCFDRRLDGAGRARRFAAARAGPAGALLGGVDFLCLRPCRLVRGIFHQERFAGARAEVHAHHVQHAGADRRRVLDSLDGATVVALLLRPVDDPARHLVRVFHDPQANRAARQRRPGATPTCASSKSTGC